MPPRPMAATPRRIGRADSQADFRRSREAAASATIGASANAAFPSGTVTAPAYDRVRVCRTPGIFLLHISRRFELDLSPMALQGACVAGLALATGQLGGTGLVSALVVACQRVTGRCSEDHSGPPLGIRPLG